MTATKKNLYSPVKFGRFELSNRVALAPLTRYRADEDHTPTELMAQYYEQRAQTEGSLLITEATLIGDFAGLKDYVPGLWTVNHIEGWRVIADRIHKHNSVVFAQLWAMGRRGEAELLKAKGFDHVGASSAPLDSHVEPPREMTKDEIKKHIDQYVVAAKNAIKAGMDGIEVHGAHGYLPNQFMLLDNSRTDEYGSQCAENRVRFTLELMDALGDAIGWDRVALRISPWYNTPMASYGGDVSPLPVYTHLITELQRRANDGKQLAYLHVIEPRVQGFEDVSPVNESNDWIRLIWKGPMVRAGGYTKELAESHTAQDDQLVVAFGRYYTSNPDLTVKMENSVELTKYDRPTFYTRGVEGYTTFQRSF